MQFYTTVYGIVFSTHLWQISQLTNNLILDFFAQILNLHRVFKFRPQIVNYIQIMGL